MDTTNSIEQNSFSMEEGGLRTEIGGFDRGSRFLLKEPALYLSMAILIAIACLTFNSTPELCVAAILITLIAAPTLHLLAERHIFAGAKDTHDFSPPAEGLFVLTFGSLLPGISLLAYALYTICTSHTVNILDEIGKVALLLIVPIFNFSVWSSVRKRYLTRPRLIGLMNGLSMGLSGAWTLLWLRCLTYSPGDLPCKFGWMFLLSLAPFMLFAAVALCRELCRKTEANISRITNTFSLMGVLLSAMFFLAPVAHSVTVESLLNDARSGSSANKLKATNELRGIAKEEDLRPLQFPVSGFTLGQLLLGNRGLASQNERDRHLYFRLTGNVIEDAGKTAVKATTDQYVASTKVGSVLEGLAMSNSQISGNVDATTLSAYLDWNMSFHNGTTSPQEARGEIELPPGAVVSQATLWMNGKPQGAVFAPTAAARQAYQSTVEKARDPLLVTTAGSNKVLFQCWPVPASGEAKIRIGIAVPLKPGTDGDCLMQFPSLLSTNFTKSRRDFVRLESRDKLFADEIGDVVGGDESGYSVNGAMHRREDDQSLTTLHVSRTKSVEVVAVKDPHTSGRFIVEKVGQRSNFTPKRLFIVIDTSASLKKHCSEIQQALAKIPERYKPSIYLCSSENDDKASEETKPISLKEAQAKIKPEMFVGGQDNRSVLTEAMEMASERPASSVLWIHGPQPITTDQNTWTAPNILHSLHLYDYQFEPGENAVLQSLQLETLGTKADYELISRRKDAPDDFRKMLAAWANGTGETVVQRMQTTSTSHMDVISTPQICDQVASLYINDEVAKLIGAGRIDRAESLAAEYHLVTAVTGAVVLEHKLQPVSQPRDQSAQKLYDALMQLAQQQRDNHNYAAAANIIQFASGVASVTAQPANASSGSSGSAGKSSGAKVGTYTDTYLGLHQWFSDSGGGLVGAPVDPRYGQSNELGQLADFGYDNARDVSRVCTALSFVVSIIFGFWSRRKRNGQPPGVSMWMLVIGLAFGVATMVHLVGTFLINNFGGLGGGL
jgi:hypothetical protein